MWHSKIQEHFFYRLTKNHPQPVCVYKHCLMCVSAGADVPRAAQLHCPSQCRAAIVQANADSRRLGVGIGLDNAADMEVIKKYFSISIFDSGFSANRAIITNMFNPLRFLMAAIVFCRVTKLRVPLIFCYIRGDALQPCTLFSDILNCNMFLIDK